MSVVADRWEYAVTQGGLEWLYGIPAPAGAGWEHILAFQGEDGRRVFVWRRPARRPTEG